jgi:hypothetical protein
MKPSLKTLLIKPIEEFSFDELSVLVESLNTTYFHEVLEASKLSHRIKKHDDYLKRRIARKTAKQKAEAEIYPWLRLFVEKHLGPNDIVCFRGVKGDSNIRQIIKIKPDTIIGSVMRKRKTHIKDVWKYDVTPYSSENSIEKLDGWLDTRTNIWYKRIEIIEMAKTTAYANSIPAYTLTR